MVKGADIRMLKREGVEQLIDGSDCPFSQHHTCKFEVDGSDLGTSNNIIIMIYNTY